MNDFSRDDLRELIAHAGSPCVSIYMPTHRPVPDMLRDQMELKNLLRSAERLLSEQGAGADEIDDMMKPAWDLLGDESFWSHPSDGLAIFIADGILRTYRVAIYFKESVSAGERFYVNPLIPLLSGDGRYYLLALSRKDVRFFEGSREGLLPIELRGVPVSFDDHLSHIQIERQPQFHSGAPSGRGGSIYYGSNGEEAKEKKYLLEFFRAIDNAVRAHIGAGQAPLLLAGVDSVLSIYRDASRYHHLIDGRVTGNPDHLSPRELHELAWALIAPYYGRQGEQALAKFRQLLGTGLASATIDEVVPAAEDGRVEALFLAYDAQENGARNDVMVTEEEEITNLATLQTLANGGMVYAVPATSLNAGGREKPHVAALFRY